MFIYIVTFTVNLIGFFVLGTLTWADHGNWAMAALGYVKANWPPIMHE